MEQQVNLWQPIFRAEKRLFSARAIGSGLGLLAVALVALAGYAAFQSNRAEGLVAQVEKQEAGRLALLQRSATESDEASRQAVETEIAGLARQVEARERALRAIGQSGTPANGFAARLDALARPALDGLWLKRIVFDPARGGLALRGATTDPTLVPEYLAELRGDAALAGASFADFRLRRARDEDDGAAAVFTIAAPGLAAVLDSDPFADADDPKGVRP
jgi:hypothetical protein